MLGRDHGGGWVGVGVTGVGGGVGGRRCVCVGTISLGGVGGIGQIGLSLNVTVGRGRVGLRGMD